MFRDIGMSRCISRSFWELRAQFGYNKLTLIYSNELTEKAFFFLRGGYTPQDGNRGVVIVAYWDPKRVF